MTDFSDNFSSDFELQQQALAARGRDASDAKFVLQRPDLWGYLQPVGESERRLLPFFDFQKDIPRYTVRIPVPFKKHNEAVTGEIAEHKLTFTREAENQPTVIKNRSNVLNVQVNRVKLCKDESCAIYELDTVQLFGPSGRKIYDYVYRDATLRYERSGEMYEYYVDGSILLGKGGFGEVSSVFHSKTRKYYAAKKIQRLPKLPSYEICCMQKLGSHPNICELQDVFFHGDGNIFLVVEICREGSLSDYLKDEHWLGEDTARNITLQICSAMTYVHSFGIVHRDLKPQNILMASRYPTKIKIADFGLAKSQDIDGLMTTMCGSEMYVAPEVVVRPDINLSYDNRVDSWSVGVMVVEMLTGHHPSVDRARKDEGTLERISKRVVDLNCLEKGGFHKGTEAFQFAQCLLRELPEDRLTLKDALNQPWLQQLAATGFY